MLDLSDEIAELFAEAQSFGKRWRNPEFNVGFGTRIIVRRGRKESRFAGLSRAERWRAIGDEIRALRALRVREPPKKLPQSLPPPIVPCRVERGLCAECGKPAELREGNRRMIHTGGTACGRYCSGNTLALRRSA